MIEVVAKFALGIFVVWRLSSLFAREHGPYGIFNKIRIGLFTASIKTQNHKFVSELFHTISDGITCMWCNSIWFSALVALFISSGVVEWMAYTLALSACAILLEENYGNRKD